MIGQSAIFSDEDSSDTPHILDSSINLTVTSPPFLNIVKYTDDNWQGAGSMISTFQKLKRRYHYVVMLGLGQI